jgi:hypothetical protein
MAGQEELRNVLHSGGVLTLPGNSAGGVLLREPRQLDCEADLSVS